METVHTFLAMGGYAAFVWPAYMIAAGVLAALLLLSLRSARSREAELAELRQARRAEVQEAA